MNVAEWDRSFLWRFRADVWRVIDGDTFVALPDCGFGVSGFPHIRLADYSAAESSQDGGETATATLLDALTWSTHKWPLRIESQQRVRVVEGTKSFDRYVALVWVVARDGEMIPLRDLLTDEGDL